MDEGRLTRLLAGFKRVRDKDYYMRPLKTLTGGGGSEENISKVGEVIFENVKLLLFYMNLTLLSFCVLYFLIPEGPIDSKGKS